MKPLTLRTKLTLFYSITVSVLLSGFALIYYRVLSVGLDRNLTQCGLSPNAVRPIAPSLEDVFIARITGSATS